MVNDTCDELNLDKEYLTVPLQYYFTQFKTAVDNNIWMRYYGRLKKYVRMLVPDVTNVEAYKLAQDLLLHKFDPKIFSQEEVEIIVPVKSSSLKTTQSTIRKNLHQFWLAQFKMLKVLENEVEDVKLFQVFPFQSKLVPAYITIDNKTLNSIIPKALFIDKKKIPIGYADDGVASSLWDQFFLLDNKAFKRRGYNFNYMIKTDGVGCSILFNRNDMVEAVRQRKKNAVLARKKIDTIKVVSVVPKTQKTTKIEYFKKEDCNIDDCKLVGIDPGVNTLLYCNDGTKTMQYRRRFRKYELKTTAYDKRRRKATNEDVQNAQKEMSDFSMRTLDVKVFQSYIDTRRKHWKVLQKCYQQRLYRKLKWYSYINGRRSEDNFCQRFKNTYGKHAIACVGDWSRNEGFKWNISKGVGLRNVLVGKTCK